MVDNIERAASNTSQPQELSSSRLSVSDVGGLSWAEIASDDSDDILPKTDYTYAKTASYSARYLSRKRCRSPNMSRRKIRGGSSSFLSDDEEDDEFLDEDYNTESVVSSISRVDGLGVQSPPPSEAVALGRGDRHSMVTSTPMYPHDEHHISTHDHYYNGMLLRSGSHIHGAEWYRDPRDPRSRRSEGSALLSHQPSAMMESASRRRSGRNTTTTVTTTTTTTTTELEEEMRKQKEMALMESDEMKRKLDESQSEKDYVDNVYHLPHFDGLDSDGEISDVDDIVMREDYGEAAEHRHQQWSMFTLITTVVTTVVTTITSTAVATAKAIGIVEDSSSSSEGMSLVGSVARVVSAPVVVPAKWAWRAVVTTCSWLVTQSVALLLTEIEMKQRRRRGCCCCLLPLLLLLPLALLAGHYSESLHQEAGVYLSRSQNLISNSWAYLWLSESNDLPVYQVPPPVKVSISSDPPSQEIHHHHHQQQQQVDMAEIRQYIQEIVLQATATHLNVELDRREREKAQEEKEELPPPPLPPAGMTEDQVRALVAAMLADTEGGIRQAVDGDMGTLKGILQKDISSLQEKMLGLQADLQSASLAQQAMSDNLQKATVGFEGIHNDQRMEWTAASEALTGQMLKLQSELEIVKAQTETLTALVTSCCQKNNSAAAAANIKEQVLAAMAQFGVDEDHPAWTRLLASLGGLYVERSELDHRLDAVSAEIMERLRVLLAQQRERDLEEEEASKGNVDVQGTLVAAGIDEMAVKTIIDEALIQFSADRIGLPDFALESAGGSVLSVRCSETYYRKTALVSVFGIPLWYTSNSPRTVIQPNVHPGECWAFKGQTGYIVIQLSYPVQPTGFTLEHIPRSLSPQGRIDSAPKEFAVFGLLSETDTQGINLGNYTYLDNGRPIQYFSIQNTQPGIFQLVELRVLSNHGNREYTCLYRFRVHGLV